MKFISLFSGAGGLDLGFEEQGFEPIIAYDINPAAVETYNFNRNKEIAHQADLSQFTGEQIINQISNLESNGAILGVVGGPPCQYFSVGNRSPNKNGDDPRRKLPKIYAEILTCLNSEYAIDFFIFENVNGLAKPAHRDDFNELIKLFEGAGFNIFHEILDAYNFGVPQFRKRVFIIGWNKQKYPTVDFIFPKGHPSELTVEDTIRGISEPIYFAKDLDSQEFPVHPNHWTMVPRSKKFNNLPPTNESNGSRSFRRLAWEAPSYTVAYGHNEIHVHPEGHRRLSIYEAMLLQGFPAKKGKYELKGSLTQQVNLISDAVPPPLASELAKSISDYLKRMTS